MRHRKRGFTLIELLVVIAIIAILAAILFPVFTRAKKEAQLNGCVNNMKQWSIALLGYLDDYDGRFPYAGCMLSMKHRTNLIGPGKEKGSDVCYTALAKYAGKSEGIKWCPRFMAIYGGEQYKAWREQTLGWSYFYLCEHHNSYVASYPEASLCSLTGPHCMSEIKRPSAKRWLLETAPVHEAGDDERKSGICITTHACCDGHVIRFTSDYRTRVLHGYTYRDGRVPTEMKGPYQGY